jgi:hypothetical protein
VPDIQAALRQCLDGGTGGDKCHKEAIHIVKGEEISGYLPEKRCEDHSMAEYNLRGNVEGTERSRMTELEA